MSHSPPVPHGNQSPYPIQEPKHVHHQPSAPQPATKDDDTSLVDELRALPLVAIGAAIGLGAALIGGAVWGYTRYSEPKPRRSKSKSKRRS